MGRTRAVSLVELIIAICFISVVVIAAASMYTSATNFFTTFDAQAELQNRANIVLQEMTIAIFLAERVEVPEDNNSELTVWLSPTESFKYWLDGSNNILRGDPEGESEEIASGVEELEFSVTYYEATNRNRLQIVLEMQGKFKLQNLRFETEVTARIE